MLAVVLALLGAAAGAVLATRSAQTHAANATILASFVQPVPPTVASLEDVDAMIAGTKQSTSTTGNAHPLEQPEHLFAHRLPLREAVDEKRLGRDKRSLGFGAELPNMDAQKRADELMKHVTHDDLLQGDGLYAHLARLQFLADRPLSERA